mmetsp:Transcript_2998/g.3673  ORF Transcript_2998/g.3673 Transcript_2998/m.3673 type:complete len:80 (+) Transcript_2998:779-1018(+)
MQSMRTSNKQTCLNLKTEKEVEMALLNKEQQRERSALKRRNHSTPHSLSAAEAEYISVKNELNYLQEEINMIDDAIRDA